MLALPKSSDQSETLIAKMINDEIDVHKAIDASVDVQEKLVARMLKIFNAQKEQIALLTASLNASESAKKEQEVASNAQVKALQQEKEGLAKRVAVLEQALAAKNAEASAAKQAAQIAAARAHMSTFLGRLRF